MVVKRPPHLHLTCQIDPIHHARKFDICKDHCDVSPADQHCCECRFGTFTFDRVELSSSSSIAVRPRNSASSSTSIPLDVSVGLVPFPRSLSVRHHHQSICATAPPPCGIGAHATSANCIRSPPARVSGNFVMSSEKAVGRRIAVLPHKHAPPPSFVINPTEGVLFRGFAGKKRGFVLLGLFWLNLLRLLHVRMRLFQIGRICHAKLFR